MEIRMLVARLIVVIACLGASAAAAQGAPQLSKGQTLYLPIYSQVSYGELDSKGQARVSLLSALVSIRNTDLTRPIRVTSAQYYDTDGKKLAEHIASPRTIKPMGTHEIFIPRSEKTGGSGANFVIKWQSDAAANPPLVEAVHAEILGQRSFAFTTSARPISTD